MTHFKVKVNYIYVRVFPLDSGVKSAVREKKKAKKIIGSHVWMEKLTSTQ